MGEALDDAVRSRSRPLDVSRCSSVVRKRTNAAVTAAGLAIAALAHAGGSADSLCGDVNGSGSVTSSDALQVLKFAVGQPVSLICASLGQLARTGEATAHGAGSDGDLQVGREHSFTDNSDGTITDNLTGLMWEVKDLTATTHGSHQTFTWTAGSGNMDGTIQTTFLASLNGGGGYAGYTDWRVPNLIELESIRSVGAHYPAVFGEFQHDCTQGSGCTSASCSCTTNNFFWSSTTNPKDPVYAFGVYFADGLAYGFPKTSSGFLRAVRTVTMASVLSLDHARGAGGSVCGDVNGSGGVTSSDALQVLKFAVGQPVELGCNLSGQLPRTGQTVAYGAGSDGAVQAGAARSFTDNGDGTITDNLTGLMWEKKDLSSGIHGQTFKSWSAGSGTMDGTMVTSYLAALNGGGGAAFAGHSDWRIPNLLELESIRSTAAANPAVFSEFHNNCTPGCTIATCSCTSANFFWSSTTFDFNETTAWGVYFTDGQVFALDKTVNGVVRAVRNAD